MKFVSDAGIIIETYDPVKIDICRSMGMVEFKAANPQPSQENVIVVDDYTVTKRKL